MTQILQTPPQAALSVPVLDEAKLPSRVGKWELVNFLSAGGLARIFRARPAGAGPDQPALYALKMLLPAWENDPQAVRLLQREALVGQKISHLHLIPILDAGLRNTPRFVVMPWLEGATLEQRLATDEYFDLPRILWIARQTAEALDALHQSGWMHSDVKPSNIMVSTEGHVTLLDLGFARQCNETGSAVDRCVLGTFHYIAPELLTSALRRYPQRYLQSGGGTVPHVCRPTALRRQRSGGTGLATQTIDPAQSPSLGAASARRSGSPGPPHVIQRTAPPPANAPGINRDPHAPGDRNLFRTG